MTVPHTRAEAAAFQDLLDEVRRRTDLKLDIDVGADHPAHVVLDAVRNYLSCCSACGGLGEVVREGVPEDCRLCFEIRVRMGRYEVAAGLTA